ncbi:transposase [Pedobacter sp. HMF7647]|uniref:Transposase n=1 Tax=Hufsiella arboris TaxID=2695275 RepID=A0A7K1YBF6_9SPHI|nr:transposase [Hufsiella arboris]MXV51691.1 transposase [Hufsiella arboris]
MSHKYKVKDQEEIHFITFAIVDWVDVFIRPVYKNIIAESLKYCRYNKGLNLHAYCLMTNHLHLLVSARHPEKLAQIIRDLKKFTNKQIIAAIQHEQESRREWMLHRFSYHAKFSNRIKDFKVWQDGYHAIECSSLALIAQKLDYIHNNPVKAGIVLNPEDYIYSSASNYIVNNGILDVEILNVGYSGVGNSV